LQGIHLKKIREKKRRRRKMTGEKRVEEYSIEKRSKRGMHLPLRFLLLHNLLFFPFYSHQLSSPSFFITSSSINSHHNIKRTCRISSKLRRRG